MFTPWNLYPTRNAYTNALIEAECFNLLKPDETIQLGLNTLSFFQGRSFHYA